MLLRKEHDPIQSGGLGAGGDFKIAASAKAFEILSSNLYQDKILAVIREISCNAADAHTQVGRPFSDIEIHLPTYLKPDFSVRDYGPGLCQQDIFHLYTTYFQSSKDNSNDLIGGFGLGSKSPFSLVDQFTVTSWHGGMCSEYVMYKDSGVPRVNMIRSVPSNDPTGLMVQLSAKGSHSEWIAKATEFFRWWQVVPKFTGGRTEIKSMLEPDNLIVTSVGKVGDYPEWALCKEVSYGTTLVAFMGLVPYSIQLSAIPNLPYSLSQFFNNKKAIFAFNVGELSINPSREALSYDTQTCALLLARFNQIEKGWAGRINLAIQNCPTLYDARALAYGVGGLLSGNRPNTSTVTWKNKRVPDTVYLRLVGNGKDKSDFATDISCGKLVSRYNNTWRKQLTDREELYHQFFAYGTKKEDTEVIWFPKLTAKTYKTVIHNRPVSGDRNTITILAGSTFADVQSVLLDKGWPEPIDGTTLPEPPKVPRAAVSNVPKTKGYAYQKNSDPKILGGFSRTENDIDLKGGGLYITHFDGRAEQPLQYLRAALADGWIPDTTRLIGLRRAQTQTKKFQTLAAAQGWEEYNPAWFQKNISDADIYKSAKHTHLELLRYANSYPILKFWSLLANLISKHKKLHPNSEPKWRKLDVLLPLVEDIFSITTAHSFLGSSFSWASPSQAAQLILAKTDAASAVAAWIEFQKEHPILEHINNTQIDNPKFHTALIDYLSTRT